MPHKFPLRFFCIFIAIFGLWLSEGHAGLDSDSALERELQYLQTERYEVFVEGATKTRVSAAKVPGDVTVFNLAQIRQSNAKTIADLLRLVAGVHVRQNPMTQTITMRGYGQTPFTSRVLLLIDGVPYNDWNKGGFIQQPGLDFFPLENVKQLEVIRGPGSALYGENAQWGVINIKTISGEDINGVRATHYLGSRDTEVSNLQLGKQFTDDFSVLVTGKYLRSQFPTSIWFDDQNDPNVRATDLYAKARYKNLTASYYRYDDSADGFAHPVQAPGLPPDAKFISADDIKQTSEIFALNYKQQLAGGDYSFASDLSYARRNGSHCGTCHARPQSKDFDGRKEDHGFQAIGDFRFGIHSLPNNDILMGAEVRRVDAGGHKDELGTSINPGGGNTTEDHGVNAYTKPAFYLQDIVSLFDDRLNLTLGLRYDAKTSPSLFNDAFSPRFAAVFDATDKLTLRAGWSKAFRFPSFSELYQNSWFLNVKSDIAGSTFPLAVFKPNPNLRPETIQNAEIGAEYRFNDFFTSKLNLYHSTIDNSIVLVSQQLPPPSPGTVASENHPNQAIIMGGELEFLFNFSETLHGFTNWSFKHTEQDGNGVDSSGKPIEFVYAPTHQANVGAYAGPYYGLSSAIEYSWQDEYMAPSFYYGLRGQKVSPLHDYGYLNLRFNYKPPITVHKAKDPLILSVYLKNLLDNQPEETFLGEKSTAPGREVFFGVELMF